MPRVTVGLPFFDEARHLGDAIRSVLAQTFSDFELLLVDDGSRDDSLAIARSFRDPRITVLADGRRRHLPARLNEIVSHARSPFIARMDADDVMHPARLARQLAFFDRAPDTDVVGTWGILVDGEERPFAVIEPPPLPPTPRSALERGIVPHATVLAKRAWFVRNPYDETRTRTEDRDLWCRTVRTTRFGVVPACLFVNRVDPGKAGFLGSYVESQRQSQRLFLEYGPAFVGMAETARLVVTARAKAMAMSALFRLGLAERLIRRRGRPPTEDERALAREALLAARAVSARSDAPGP